MTAVEWLFYRMIMDKTLSEKADFMHEAKEMEKNQIMDAWNDGQSDGATICTQKADNPSEEYYNKTFKSE